MNYSIEWLGSNVFIQFFGEVNLIDIIEINSQLYGDSRFVDMRFQLIDYTQLQLTEISKEDLEIIGSLEKSQARWNSQLKIANVVTNKYFIELLTEYKKEMFNSSWEVEIFNSIDDAKKWVGMTA